jgi:hypothetical protein
MKMFLVALCLFSLSAFAGFEGLNNNVSLKVFNKINCGTGLTCTKVGDKFNIVNSSNTGTASLQNRVTATATTITASQCGSTFINAGAIEIELPEASTVLGCRLTFIVGNASTFTIDPDAADTIMLLTNAAGDSLAADAVGESLVLEAISASAWAPVGAEKGTWTDSN